MNKIKKLLGYLLYCSTSFFPHYQLGLEWKLIKKVRALAGKLYFEYCGKNVDIGRKVKLSPSISLGDRSSIGDESYLQGKITIGKDVMMAPRCALIGANHLFLDVSLPMNQQGKEEKEIIIEDDVWIGYGVTILAGCRVSKGAICAAGSVVTKDVEPYTIVGGNPARPIKKRD